MKKIITIEKTICDICESEILDKSGNSIKIQEQTFDMCDVCKPKFDLIVQFLTLTVNIPIDYIYIKKYS
jgi:hypothetical protein